MCDDNWDDWDGLDDDNCAPDNDSEEEEADLYECDFDIGSEPENILTAPEENKFSLSDALIIGSMYCGCAYELETEPTYQKKSVKQEKSKRDKNSIRKLK
jgi:hypothetical protein